MATVPCPDSIKSATSLAPQSKTFPAKSPRANCSCSASIFKSFKEANLSSKRPKAWSFSICFCFKYGSWKLNSHRQCSRISNKLLTVKFPWAQGWSCKLCNRLRYCCLNFSALSSASVEEKKPLFIETLLWSTYHPIIPITTLKHKTSEDLKDLHQSPQLFQSQSFNRRMSTKTNLGPSILPEYGPLFTTPT